VVGEADTSTSERVSTNSMISSTVGMPSLNVEWTCRIALPTLYPSALGSPRALPARLRT
jgi:hypothetical protein